MRSNVPDESQRLASEAIERFEERRPYLMWNEVAATHVVGSRPPADVVVFNEVLDAWEGEVQLQLKMSGEVRDALTKYVEANATRLRTSGALKDVTKQWASRNEYLNQSLDRIRNLRATRPR